MRWDIGNDADGDVMDQSRTLVKVVLMVMLAVPFFSFIAYTFLFGSGRKDDQRPDPAPRLTTTTWTVVPEGPDRPLEGTDWRHVGLQVRGHRTVPIHPWDDPARLTITEEPGCDEAGCPEQTILRTTQDCGDLAFGVRLEGDRIWVEKVVEDTAEYCSPVITAMVRNDPTVRIVGNVLTLEAAGGGSLTSRAEG
ncbi:hypothetical protein ACE2AJ_10240 [Aquihabitans daechungensis]|uniref:hypothetical protein n=1 Tax=Aquihabitans daechungensis TaxID=1052257 RepID=UPI003BA07345